MIESNPTRKSEAAKDYESNLLILKSLKEAAELKKKKKAKNPIKKALKPC